MFSELVLEVLSEEIPSRMHKCMISQVEAYFNKSFAKDSISVSDMHIFINALDLHWRISRGSFHGVAVVQIPLVFESIFVLS